MLEIGAGTGKATKPLAEKGFNIDCIEIEPKMAEILKNKCNDFNVSLIIDNFETWENRKGHTYDLIKDPTSCRSLVSRAMGRQMTLSEIIILDLTRA